MISPEAQQALTDILARDMKALFRDEESYLDILEASKQRGGKDPDPDYRWLEDLEAIKRCTPDGAEYWQLLPREMTVSISELNDVPTIIYFHGGGFVLPAEEPQWRFAAALCKAARAQVLVPSYPLAPLATFRDTYSAALSVYQTVLSDRSDAHITLIGDSAGGHLAVGLAQLVMQKTLPLPERVFALSPWIDLFDAIPYRVTLDANDPLISLNGLRHITSMWASKSNGSANATEFPPDILKGPFCGLPPLHIYVGSREVLFPDSYLLAKKASEAGVSVTLRIATGLWHTYPLFPALPEAQQVLQEIAFLISGR